MTIARTHVVAAAMALALFAVPQPAQPQAVGIAVALEKHGVLTSQGVAVVQMHISCGPFEGFEEFQEGLAGGGQARTGAEAEGGIDGTIVCDGVERPYTAHLSPFTDAGFAKGPATFTASLFVCMIVEDEQQCYHGSSSRRVILRGGPVR